MVAGIIKEMITIVAAVAVFGDHFGWLNGLGLGIAIFGVALFNLYKLRRLRTAEAQDVIVARRPGGGSVIGSGVGSGIGGGGSSGGGGGGAGKEVEILHPALLIQRANSRNAGGALAGSGGSGGSRDGARGGAWRVDAGMEQRRRASGSLSGSGVSVDEEEAGLENEPLLAGGGGAGGGDVRR
jgi:hypothetical protein